MVAGVAGTLEIVVVGSTEVVVLDVVARFLDVEVVLGGSVVPPRIDVVGEGSSDASRSHKSQGEFCAHSAVTIFWRK